MGGSHAAPGIARIAVLALAAWFVGCAAPASAQGAPPALSGKIASDREGAMEGVLVSAKKPGSTITVTVVSDAKGDYAFPADRLAPGSYKLTIGAAGYALEARARSSSRPARPRPPTSSSSPRGAIRATDQRRNGWSARPVPTR